jgi:hypothetical protein
MTALHAPGRRVTVSSLVAAGLITVEDVGVYRPGTDESAR